MDSAAYSFSPNKVGLSAEQKYSYIFRAVVILSNVFFGFVFALPTLFSPTQTWFAIAFSCWSVCFIVSVVVCFNLDDYKVENRVHIKYLFTRYLFKLWRWRLPKLCHLDDLHSCGLTDQVLQQMIIGWANVLSPFHQDALCGTRLPAQLVSSDWCCAVVWSAHTYFF